MGPSTGMPCRELVELVTACLDGALLAGERARCDEHLRTCAGCRAYRAHMEALVGGLGELHREQEEDRAEKAWLLHLFRTRGHHNRAPRKRTVPLGVADELAAPGDHIGYFWEHEQELDATADFAWTGSFGTSQSGLPAIGPLRGKPNCFAVLGFGGNGITFAMIAAQVIRGYLRGPRDPDADVFAFK